MKGIMFKEATLNIVRQVKRYEKEYVQNYDGSVSVVNDYTKPYFEVELIVRVPRENIVTYD